MGRLVLAPIDYSILLTYTLFVLGTGWLLKEKTKTSEDFFHSGHGIPAWIAGLAFLSANLGAQEVMGMAASGAKYGLMTSHFYWVGAVPAMLFVGVFMMPFYYGSKARSVPEYLRLRFDEKTRGLNAITFAAMTIFSSGVSLYALGLLLSALLGWDFDASILAAAAIVLVYVFFGGLTSAIYNEVLQFFLIVAGFLPLVVAGIQDVGGWGRLVTRLNAVAVKQGFAAGTYTQIWQHTGYPAQNPMGVEWFGLSMGLGFVLSFGYWCTDFLVVQRAMAAESMDAARRTPLIAAVPKMIFPFLVIVPGLIAIALTLGGDSSFQLPVKHDGTLNYDMTIPMMLAHYFPPGLLGLGLTALMASFMSGMAGNVTAFNTVFTYDIYGAYIRPNASESHYLKVGRLTTVAGILASVLAAYAAVRFNNIMDLLQLVFAFVNAPLFGTFLLGMFWKRATGHGAFWGLLLGTVSAALHHGLTLPAHSVTGLKGGWLGVVTNYPSEMAQNFWTAIWAFSICFAATFVISLVTKPKPDEELRGLCYALTDRPKSDHRGWRPEMVAIGILVAIGALNVIFWYEESMALDLRIVIGRLLMAIGLQLFVYGFLSEGRAASMNIAWGGAITITGGIFHLFRRLGKTA